MNFYRWWKMYSNRETRRCPRWHKFSLKNKVEDVTLIKKSGGYLAIKNSLYDQLKRHKFCFQLAKIDKFLQVDDAI